MKRRGVSAAERTCVRGETWSAGGDDIENGDEAEEIENRSAGEDDKGNGGNESGKESAGGNGNEEAEEDVVRMAACCGWGAEGFPPPQPRVPSAALPPGGG